MTGNGKSSSHIFWSAMALAALAHLLLFDAKIIAAPVELQVQFIPDDAYYYMALARHYAESGVWSFDSGNSTTTGFHPLHAYCLALIKTVFKPGDLDFARYGVAMGALLTGATAVTAWIIGWRLNSSVYMALLALFLSSRNVALQSVAVMEWPLVVLFAALYAVYFHRNLADGRMRHALCLAAIAFAGSLSRSDFGLFPAAILFAAVVVFWRTRQQKSAVLVSLAGFCGAVAGVLVVFAHNHAISGQWLQSSALMKAHWAQMSDKPNTMLFELLPVTLGLELFALRVAIPVFAMVCAALIFFTRRTRSKSFTSTDSTLDASAHHDLTLAIAALVCLAGYFVVYNKNGGLQNWYTANLMVPTFLLLVALSRLFEKLQIGAVIGQRLKSTQILGSTVFVILVMCINMLSVHVYPPWPTQVHFLRAGQYLRNHPPAGRVAAWNAGIVGYYQGGTVINIDGLVNDNIYSYAVAAKLPQYISDQKIAFIVDYQKMINDPAFRKRGGYDDPAFLARLKPMRTFDDGSHFVWKHLTLFKVLPSPVKDKKSGAMTAPDLKSAIVPLTESNRPSRR